MNLLNKLTIKNLKLNKKRTIVTIIGIMLSVALITAVSSIYSSALDSMIVFESREKGAFHVKYSNVSINDISNFKNNRKIEEFYLTEDIGYFKLNSKNEYKPYAFVKAFTKKSLENLSIKLVEGSLPTNVGEVVIPTHLKTNGRVELKIGDKITVNVGDRLTGDGKVLNQNNPYNNEEKISESREFTYKVVGIIERPATNIEPYSAPGYTFITYISEKDLIGDVDLYARYNKEGIKDAYRLTANILGINEDLFDKMNKGEFLNEQQQHSILKEIEEARYQVSMNDYLIKLQNNPIKNSGIGGLGAAVIVVIIIIVFTSVFCIKNSFDISITEKTKQYGMLRSVGATKKQIKRNVFYEATILGLIAIPLGIVSGLLATFILIIISNYLLKGMVASGFKLSFSISMISIIIAIFLGIITIYLSAFKSARRASKSSPIDSVRNNSNIKIDYKKVKSPKIIKKLFGIGGEISYKNLKRNKKKYRTTVISIIVSVSVFIGLYSFMNLATQTLKEEISSREYNLHLYANYSNSDVYKNFINTTELSDIEDYTVLRSEFIDVSDISGEVKFNKEYIKFFNYSKEDLKDAKEGNIIMIVSLGDYQYKKYIKQLGLKYNDIKNKAILIDYEKVETRNNDKLISKYMRTYDYNRNDYIKIKKQGKEDEFQIGFVTREKPFGLKNNYGPSAYLVLSEGYFDSLYDANSVEIFYKTDKANELQDNIDDLLKDEDYSLDNYEENVKMVKNFYTLVGVFLYGFIIVISLIGATNIFNTITTNIELRKQEFAMLKSIGMTKREFKRMVMLESIFMGIKSLTFGIILGSGISYIIYLLLGKNEGLPYCLPIGGIILSIVSVFILISVIMKYSMNKINKQNIIETIRNENI